MHTRSSDTDHTRLTYSRMYPQARDKPPVITFPHWRSRTHTRASEEFRAFLQEMFSKICGLGGRFATALDVESHAGTQATPLSQAHDEQTRVWGPIPSATAKSAGALEAAQSLCLKAVLPNDLWDQLHALIPEATRQRPGDTKQILMRRIFDCNFFERAMVLQNGCGPRRVQLLGTTYPQPRRLSWSVVDASFAYLDAETNRLV